MSTVLNRTEALNAQLGLFGFDAVADTTPRSGKYAAIQVVEDAVFSSLTVNNSDATALISKTLPAGTVLFGDIVEFTLSIGTVIAYKQKG